jgi:uncharacterized protein with HEPN domain
MWSDPSGCLHDIADAASNAQTLLNGLTRDQFARLPENNWRDYRALKNAIVEVGEGIKALSQDIFDRHPEVDWRGLAKLRDVVVHRYPKIDLALLWPVLKEEFPALLAAVREELERQSGSGQR